MIGNDIVDLQAAAIQSNWRRPGFLQKIFSEAEQRQIKLVGEPDRLIWTFWSMKEAAYKAQQREFGLKRSFAPSQFGCTINHRENSSASGKVCIGNREYFTKTIVKDACVHTTATASAATKTFSRIYPSSAEIKKHLIEAISSTRNLPQSYFRIEKDRNSIPVLRCGEQLTGYPFSISHHGKYAAFSLPLTKD